MSKIKRQLSAFENNFNDLKMLSLN